MAGAVQKWSGLLSSRRNAEVRYSSHDLSFGAPLKRDRVGGILVPGRSALLVRLHAALANPGHTCLSV